jgi:preprotein translocase subunit SecG
MDIAITIVHVIACFFLIIVVLLQTGKGADMGAVFGGSSQTVFGSGGAANLLTRLTTYTAIIFMLTSLFLTWASTRSLTLSVADDLPVEPPPLVAPAAPLADPAPPAADTAAPAAEQTAPAADSETAPAADAQDNAADAPAAAAPADSPTTPTEAAADEGSTTGEPAPAP